MEPKIVGGVKVIEVDPDAPLPEGVPPRAERCDVVEVPLYPAALRPWVVGLGVISTLGCVATLAYFSNWGMAPLPLSLVVLYLGLRPPVDTVLRPSPNGSHLAVEEHGDGGVADAAGRIAAMAFGVAMIAVAVGVLFSEDRDWMAISAMGMAAFYLIYHAVKGAPARDDGSQPTSSLRFRALADPSRPLTADDLRLPVARPPETGSGEPRPGS
jgi:hypothetical protein